jgi:hypothetical protein
VFTNLSGQSRKLKKQKNWQGGFDSRETCSDKRMYAQNDFRCPVAALKLLISKTDPTFNHCCKNSLSSETPNNVNIDDLNVDCSFLTVKNKLKLLCLNCCGLNLRLNYPEFGELICQHDVICIQETKTDDTDQNNFPGYIFKAKNRQKFSHRKSGGIAFGYKEKLDNFITIIKNDKKFVFWVKVSSTLFKLDEDVLIGVMYIPPEFTSYSSQEAFNDIDFDIRNFSRSYKYTSLAGDFNVRTAEPTEWQ